MDSFAVAPRGPFSLALEARFFGDWLSVPDDPRAVVLAFPVEGDGWRTSAAVVIRQPDERTVQGNVHVPAGDAEAAWQQALASLSLDEDGSGFAQVGERDPVIGRLQAELGLLRPVCFYSPYEAAVSFVIGQRISIVQTRAIRARLARDLGDALRIGEHTVYAFPRPEALLNLTTYPSLNGEKIERLHGIAAAALDGRLDRARLRQLPTDEALADLRTLRGLGAFSAQGILLRGAGLRDAVPDDEVTCQAVQAAYDVPSVPSSAEVVEQAEAWRPYRMWASVLLHVWLRRSGRPFRPTARPGKY